MGWTEEDLDAYYRRLKIRPQSQEESRTTLDRPDPGETIVLVFEGFCSKKNRKAPRPDGKGLYQEPKTRQAIERMELQVQPQARDLMLESPDVDWFITYTNGHSDADGIMTTVLDILQKYRVIRNDNLTHFHGRQTIHPPVRGDRDIVRVVLTPQK